jgi:hypothetical protein
MSPHLSLPLAVGDIIGDDITAGKSIMSCGQFISLQGEQNEGLENTTIMGSTEFQSKGARQNI